MKIEARQGDEVLFIGEADDFLEKNDYDLALEEILNLLNDACIGETALFENVEIEKLYEPLSYVD